MANEREEAVNLENAKALWEAFTKIARWGEEEKLKHLYYILYLGQFMWLINRDDRGPDVLALGTGNVGDDTVIGANVTRRRKLAGSLVPDAKPPKGASNFPQFIKDKLRFQWGAFDGELPRLVQLLEDATPVADGRPFDTCAEQVVFEKFARQNKKPLFTYALMKKGAPAKVRIVERCANCKKAGGAADANGITPNLGKVVTDDPHLLANGGLQVPIVTPRVLKFLRADVIKKYSEQVPANDWIMSNYFKVWDDVSMKGSCIVNVLGPSDANAIDAELKAAGRA